MLEILVRGGLMRHRAGHSLVEVMVALAILSLGLVGITGLFQWGNQGLLVGKNKSVALALLEARLEAKRVCPWRRILEDDLDGDGRTDIVMNDKGQGRDRQAGDGIYTGHWSSKDVQLVWTVSFHQPVPLHRVGAVTVKGTAWAPGGSLGTQVVKMGFIRSNPRFLGGA